MTTVKICGIQTIEVLQSMVHQRIDWIGFVFAKSKRQITAEQAAVLIAAYRMNGKEQSQHARMVGVFVNPTIDELKHILSIAALDVIQLHGQESPAFCQEVKDTFHVQVFKAFPSPTLKKDTPDSLFGDYIQLIDGALLDTVLPNAEGGTGMTFDWTVLPEYIDYAKQYNVPLLIAGGLNPDNVLELLHGYKPYGVDVSSGVETNGTKDIHKIARFVERVKQA